MTSPHVWVNDGLRRADDAGVCVRDRGFTLGDGVFETLRVRDRTLLDLTAHLRRLRKGAALLYVGPVPSDADLLSAALMVLEANGLRDAALRITVSRGTPRERGLLPDPDAAPTLVLDAYPFTSYPGELYARGMRLATVRERRNEHSIVSRAKTLSYLAQVVARTEAAERGCDEALLLNTAGGIACASAANVFLVLNGVLVTPPTDCGALSGIVRGVVLDRLAAVIGVTVEERPIAPSEALAAEEILLTSSLLGMMPATMLDARPVSGGIPAPTAAALSEALEAYWSAQSV